MLSNTEKEKKISEIQKYLYSMQFDFNYTLSEIAEFLNNESIEKLRLNKGDISKIQSGKVKFTRSLNKLILIHNLLKNKLEELGKNERNIDKVLSLSGDKDITDYFLNIEYDKSKNIQFNIYQLFAKKLSLKKYKYLTVFLFFILLSPVIPLIWAIKTGVWSGIDYPLKESYSTWLGEAVFAIINVTILRYYDILSYLMQFAPKYKKQAGNYTWQLILLLLSLVFSYYFHHRFTTDQIFGWCEKQMGTLSFLGYYHVIIFAIQIWIIANFIVNTYFTNLIISNLKENHMFKRNGLLLYKKGIVRSVSELLLKYSETLLINGIYVLVFLYTIYLSIDKIEAKQVPVNTGLLELVSYTCIFIICGIGFFWFFIVKPAVNLLECNKNNLMKQYPNNNRILSINIIPYDENPFRYIVISFLAIICIVTISVVSIELLNRIIESNLL